MLSEYTPTILDDFTPPPDPKSMKRWKVFFASVNFSWVLWLVFSSTDKNNLGVVSAIGGFLIVGAGVLSKYRFFWSANFIVGVPFISLLIGGVTHDLSLGHSNLPELYGRSFEIKVTLTLFLVLSLASFFSSYRSSVKDCIVYCGIGNVQKVLTWIAGGLIGLAIAGYTIQSP